MSYVYAAATGRRMLTAGWPDEEFLKAASGGLDKWENVAGWGVEAIWEKVTSYPSAWHPSSGLLLCAIHVT